MRVLVIAACPFPAGRGSQLLIERTARGLVERGHQLEVLTARFGERGRPDPFPLVRVGLPNWGRSIGSRPEIWRLIDDAMIAARVINRRADVLLGHNVEGGLIAGMIGRLRGVPSLWVRHSDFGEELAAWVSGPRARHAMRAAGAWLESRVAGRVTRRIELSAEAGSETSVDRLPPPHDPREAEIKPADGRTLYYEGNQDPYQNPGWLEYTLRELRRSLPGVRLLRSASPRTRPPAADLALLPRSLPGGFPMKLLAYQLAGVPAVCVESGAPGVRDRRDAFVVPGRGSPAAFARRVAEAMAEPDEREALRHRARERARVRHAPRRVAALLEQSLRRALDQSPGLAAPRRHSYIASPEPGTDPPP